MYDEKYDYYMNNTQTHTSCYQTRLYAIIIYYKIYFRNKGYCSHGC